MRNKVIIVTFILMIVLFLLITLHPVKTGGFHEEFVVDSVLEKHRDGLPESSAAVTPISKGEFIYGMVKSKDGMLCLSTGVRELTGGGEWRRRMDIAIGPDTALTWRWAAYDVDDYQFWVKIKFNNNRAIYYTAGGSKPPGRYEDAKFQPYKGEFFQDKEGRLRFFPSVCIIVGQPETQWSVCRRTISVDYSITYGDMPEQLSIQEVVIGMFDDSKAKVNELGIEYIMIDNSSSS